jgi:WD40 repeat protein
MKITIRNLLVFVLFLRIWIFDFNVQAQMFLDVPVALSPDGSHIAIGKPTGIIEVRDTVDFQVTYILSAHTDTVVDLAWSHNGNMLATGGLDNTVHIWSMTSGALLDSLSYPNTTTELITALEWNTDNSQIIVGRPGDTSTTISVWSIATRSIVQDLPRNYALTMEWSPDNQSLAIGVTEGVIILNWPSGSVSQILSVDLFSEPSQIFAIAWHPSAGFLASGSLGGTVRVWDLSTNQVVSEYRGTDAIYDSINLELLTTQIRALSFSSDGTQLLSFSGDGVLKVWNWTSNSLIDQSIVETPVFGAAFNSDGSGLFYIDNNQNIQSVETSVECDTKVALNDVTELVISITNANTLGTPQTLCLQGTYTLTTSNNTSDGANGLPVITSEIMLVGLGAGAEISGSLQVSGAGLLTLRNVTVTP